jgi:beta-lactam-binding protein with PASTA domain
MSEREPPAPRDEPTDADSDEITLSEEEWPVAEQYRVKPKAPPSEAASEGRTRGGPAVPGAPAGTDDAPPVRRFPPDVGPGLLLVLLAVLLLIPAAIWLASRDGDEPGSAAPGTETTNTTGPTTPTTAPTETTPTTPARTKEVPEVTGLKLGPARSALEKAELRVRVRFEKSDRPEREVVSQEPGAGAEVPQNAVVVLTVSSGPERVVVPNVVGFTTAAATGALREAGLQPEIRPIRSTEPQGTVVRQKPGAGKEVERQTVIRLAIATPPPSESDPDAVEVPQLVGLTLSEARARLRKLGLRSNVTEVASSQPKGTVVEQAPTAGAEVRKRSTVSLRVSTGVVGSILPNVIGLDEQTARQTLEAAGYEVEIVDTATEDPTQNGIVVGQAPTGGTNSPEGTLVTLTVARFA